MAAVWIRARAELRARWRSALALALLIGLGGGFVMAAAAAARRTGSAYERFTAAYPGADLFLPNPAFGADFGAVVHAPAEIAAMPQVEAMSVGRVALSGWGAAFAAADDRFGFEMPRWRMIEGRAYDPGRADEVVALHTFAHERALRVGDTINYPGDMPDDVPPECASVPQTKVTVVGVAVMPGVFFASQSDDAWTLLLPPALHDRLPSLAEQTGCRFLALPTPGMMWVKTHPGSDDAFLAELDRRAADLFVISESQRSYDQRNAESIRLQATALWVLGAAVALAAVLVLLQTVVRHVQLSADDNNALRSLGLRRRQLAGAVALSMAIPVGGGALIGVGVAVGLSPLTPLGAGRLAEPDPGVAVDLTVLLAGAAGIVVLFLATATALAWLNSRPGKSPSSHRAQPSRAVSAVVAVGAPTAAVAGVRMALERGRGRTAVPVRTSVIGVALGLAGLAAALTFGASTGHLLSTPAAYGLTVDVWINNDEEGAPFPFERYVDEVSLLPFVDGLALGDPGSSAVVDGRSVEVVPFRSVFGGVEPRAFVGRFPGGGREVLLGARTAALLGKGVGDQVSVRARADDILGGSERLTVVGIGEIPPFERVGLGEGMVISPETAASLAAACLDCHNQQASGREAATIGGMFVRFASGVDPDEGSAHVKEAMGAPGLGHFGFDAPADVVDFGRVESLPAILAIVIASLAAGTLAHVLITGVRRRRRDFAVLKTFGFVRRQTRAAVAWQATATTTVGVIIGIPAGVAAGRWAWSMLVHRVGLLPEPVVPTLAVALIVPGALLLANAIAALPARAAARTQPALALRAE